MPGRWRRSKRSMAQVDVHAHIPSLLPLTTSRKGISNAISCWYCDYKITSFNELIFQFGRRHARFLFQFSHAFFDVFVRRAICYYYFLLFVQQYRYLFSIRLIRCRIVCLFVLHLRNTLQGSENMVLDWDWFLSCRSCCCCHGLCRRFLFVVYSIYSFKNYLVILCFLFHFSNNNLTRHVQKKNRDSWVIIGVINEAVTRKWSQEATLFLLKKCSRISLHI